MAKDPSPWRDAAPRLTAALHLTAAPIAITFAAADAPPLAAVPEPMPEPTPDGRTGRVPDLATAATRADVGALVEAGWMSTSSFRSRS